MSRDQKPKAVKAVKVAESAVPAEGGGAATHGAGPEQGREGHAPPKSAFPLVPALLFLIGCIIGGAALTALPHSIPEMAAQLYGKKP